MKNVSSSLVFVMRNSIWRMRGELLINLFDFCFQMHVRLHYHMYMWKYTGKILFFPKSWWILQTVLNKPKQHSCRNCFNNILTLFQANYWKNRWSNLLWIFVYDNAWMFSAAHNCIFDIFDNFQLISWRVIEWQKLSINLHVRLLKKYQVVLSCTLY